MNDDVGNIINATEEGRAKYDETLKELLSNKQFLARILKRFVSEFFNCSLCDIENKYIEPESVSVSKMGVERNSTNLDGTANEDVTLNEGRIYCNSSDGHLLDRKKPVKKHRMSIRCENWRRSGLISKLNARFCANFPAV